MADAPWTGRELQQAGWGATVLPADRIDATLDALCANLADKPQGALRLLKAHLAREFQDLLDAPGAAVSAYAAEIATVDDAVGNDTLAVERDARDIARLRIRVNAATPTGALPPCASHHADDAAADTVQPTPEPDEWALSSPVVHASVDTDGVVLVRMEDRG
ncbi:MAG: hypothetical protein H0T88_03975, partial [Lysobacter sp.]|nr:hypothetical protein [Lysobacter sp.]